MKILITGCRGQLGTELQRQLSEEGCAIGPLPERLRKATVIPVDVDELDITDREATINYIRRHQPDTVINCAAFTNVDGCETARDAAFKVNAIGPRNLALACEKIGARLIHVSTDYVFPGTANGGVALDECAVPAPISAYGQTKLLGEQYVERFCRRHFIVRTAWPLRLVQNPTDNIHRGRFPCTGDFNILGRRPYEYSVQPHHTYPDRPVRSK